MSECIDTRKEEVRRNNTKQKSDILYNFLVFVFILFIVFYFFGLIRQLDVLMSYACFDIFYNCYITFYFFYDISLTLDLLGIVIKLNISF